MPNLCYKYCTIYSKGEEKQQASESQGTDLLNLESQGQCKPQTFPPVGIECCCLRMKT